MPRRRLHGVPRKPRNGLCLLVVVVHAAANRRSQRPGKVAARTKTSACTPSAILRRQPIIPQPIMWMRRNQACDPGTNTETTAALARCNACASCIVSAMSQYGVCTALHLGVRQRVVLHSRSCACRIGGAHGVCAAAFIWNRGVSVNCFSPAASCPSRSNREPVTRSCSEALWELQRRPTAALSIGTVRTHAARLRDALACQCCGGTS